MVKKKSFLVLLILVALIFTACKPKETAQKDTIMIGGALCQTGNSSTN